MLVYFYSPGMVAMNMVCLVCVYAETNCHFYMSSFVEDKGANHIKTKPKDFVKYNMRQNSRIYPQGNRINSSNYGPMVKNEQMCVHAHMSTCVPLTVVII